MKTEIARIELGWRVALYKISKERVARITEPVTVVFLEDHHLIIIRLRRLLHECRPPSANLPRWHQPIRHQLLQRGIGGQRTAPIRAAGHL